MTDKQIKDGIDVSQCECYSVEDNSCNDTLSGSCMKEKCQIFRLLQTIKAKEQECEELKEEIAKATMEICNQCGEKDDYNIPCKQIRDLDYGLQLEIEENDKLKQTLTEIKEIATVCIKQDICTTCNNSEKCHIEDEEIPTYDVCKLILQKISEVEDENNRKI